MLETLVEDALGASNTIVLCAIIAVAHAMNRIGGRRWLNTLREFSLIKTRASLVMKLELGFAAGIAFFAEFKTDNPAGDCNLYGQICSIERFGCQGPLRMLAGVHARKRH